MYLIQHSYCYNLHNVCISAYLLCLILSISASCLRISCSSSDSLWTGISTMPMLVITCYFFSVCTSALSECLIPTELLPRPASLCIPCLTVGGRLAGSR